MIGRREFIKQLSITGAGIGLLSHTAFDTGAAISSKSTFTPESQGVSSQGLINFFDAVDKSGLEFHSIMINRNGKTILRGW